MSQDNAALAYLWARHRIMLLSDYNRLRNDDQRVEEITELGLRSQLLTAYTSFVAVDNEVRNKSGKFTTVSQPLPLPEGVSDYAVGGHGNYAASPVMQKGWGMRSKVESRLTESDAAGEIKSPEKKDQAPKISIVHVTAGKGLTQDKIRQVAEARIGDMGKCLAGHALQGTIVLNLVIRPDGTAKKVEIDSAKISDVKLRQCIIEQVNKWLFPATARGKDVKVMITLKMY